MWVADRFQVDERPDDAVVAWSDLNTVRDGFARFGLLDDQVRFLQGPAADTLADAPIETGRARCASAVGDAADLAASLEQLYDRIAAERHRPDRRLRLARSRRGRSTRSAPHVGIDAPIERVGSSGVSWRKAASVAAPVPEADEPKPSRLRGLLRRRARRAPLAAPAPAITKDLSVVVVFYNMRREAARTLHSLSRAYQRDIDGLDYEVIVVENGSAPDQKLGEEFVRSFGPEFRTSTSAPTRHPRRSTRSTAVSRSRPATRSRS